MAWGIRARSSAQESRKAARLERRAGCSGRRAFGVRCRRCTEASHVPHHTARDSWTAFGRLEASVQHDRAVVAGGD
jgi:hypothetical protein